MVTEDLIVADPETLSPVPADGKTIGEVFFRGNVVMNGYLKVRARRPAAGRSAAAGSATSPDFAA